MIVRMAAAASSSLSSLCVWLFCVLCFITTSVTWAELRLAEVERNIDLRSHVAREEAILTFLNDGPGAAFSFLLTPEPKLAAHLAFVGATV